MQPVHLTVAAHGMWGEPIHLTELARIIRERFAEDTNDSGIKFVLLVAETNSLDSTYDGIDWGGERLADEVQAKIDELAADNKVVTRFSVVGYSLGGVLARYLVGILESRGFFDKVTPVNFTTFATPHVGLVRMNNFFSKLSFRLGPKMLSRTGPQVYGRDQWSGSKDGKPLLEAMVEPDSVFYRALAKFERRSLYGSAYGDRMVSYTTALAEEEDPFWSYETNGISFVLDEKYAPIISSYEIPSRPPTPPPAPPVGSTAHLKSLVPRIQLPPFLKLRFPLNILIYLLIPILLPLGFTAAFVKVSLDSSSSRKRLKLLESDEEGLQRRLMNVLRGWDKEMEDAIADVLEGAGEEAVENVDAQTGLPLTTPENSPQVTTAPSRPEEMDTDGRHAVRTKHFKLRHRASAKSSSTSLSDKPTTTTKCKEEKIVLPEHPQAPVLSDFQRQLIRSFNTLQFHKYTAHFPGVFSSHAVIIARDVQRFAFHKQGEGVLRHWADHFIL